jgi:hypothetical protein
MRRSTATPLFAVSVLVAALAASPAGAEQIYKWVDSSGRVNYGTKPPEGMRAGDVQKVEPKVSTVPLVKPDQGEVRAMEGREQRAREQERASELAASAAPASRVATDEAVKYWRDRCYAERRVDCDGPAPSWMVDPTFAFYPGYGVYGGGFVPPASWYPPVVRPRPPIGYFPNTAPPGYRVGPGPFGVGAQYVPLPERTPYLPVRTAPPAPAPKAAAGARAGAPAAAPR